MRPSLIIGLVVLVGGCALLIWQHDSQVVSGIDNDRFASVVALLALLVFMGGAAFSGRIRTDIRNLLIWVAVAGMLIAGYTYRDVLMPLLGPVMGQLDPSGPVAIGEDVAIRRDASGHFRVRATINGVSMPMLIDTGATRVSLSQSEAERAGVNMAALRYVTSVNTANGEVMMAATTLDDVAIGGLTVREVKAFVAPDEALGSGVIGESFLARLSGYSVRGDTLTLHP